LKGWQLPQRKRGEKRTGGKRTRRVKKPPMQELKAGGKKKQARKKIATEHKHKASLKPQEEGERDARHGVVVRPANAIWGSRKKSEKIKLGLEQIAHGK